MNGRLPVAPVLALVVTMACASPAAAAGGNIGGNVDCGAGPPQVIADYRTPKPVVTGSGVLDCPSLGAQVGDSSGRFGAYQATPGANAAGPAGSRCQLFWDTPISFRLAGSIPEWDTFNPPGWNGQGGSKPGTAVDPNAPGFVDAGWKAVDSFDMTLYERAATLDFFDGWMFRGTWDAQGRCVSGTAGGDGWIIAENVGGNPIPGANCGLAGGCFDFGQAPGPLTAGGLTVAALGPLDAFLRGQFNGGLISSLPARPNPGLAQTLTCFYVTGMTVTGGGDPLQPRDWEQIVEGPQLDAEGRHIFYVFVIHVTPQDSVWDFGDGTTLTIPPDGGSPEGLPQQCGPIANQQYLVAHDYHKYSPGNGFDVTVTTHYGVDVTELWWDGASPPAHRLDFPNAIAPVAVGATNQPYAMPVVQEEGVPVS